MRVITGKARGIQLKTPEGMLTRPTADRVKEALFSIINFDIPGARVLDLFGGTGQLGIEALSRGAVAPEGCCSGSLSPFSRSGGMIHARDYRKSPWCSAENTRWYADPPHIGQGEGSAVQHHQF